MQRNFTHKHLPNWRALSPNHTNVFLGYDQHVLIISDPVLPDLKLLDRRSLAQIWYLEVKEVSSLQLSSWSTNQLFIRCLLFIVFYSTETMTSFPVYISVQSLQNFTVNIERGVVEPIKCCSILQLNSSVSSCASFTTWVKFRFS